MLAAMKETLVDAYPKIEGYAKQVFQNEKEYIKELANQFAQGLINEEELKSELEDEKDTFEAELLALNVLNKAAIQKAAHAATDVLTQSIKALI